MVGEIVQKHLPHMTACRRKKPLKSRVGNHPYIAFLPPKYGKKLCQKWHSFLPLFLEGAVRFAP